jgi:hypothetical protein
MGLNLESLLYLQRRGHLTPKRNRVLDIGPQNVYSATKNQLHQFVAAQGQIVQDDVLTREIERLVYFSTPRPDERTTLLSEITDLTNIEYNSFDVCPALKTEILDLNFDTLPPKYNEYYDLVINSGTTEHIFNQWNCFELMHDATRVGGVMYCQLPATGYLDHGYFCYTPLFFRDIAAANKYELLDIFLTAAGLNELSKLLPDVRIESKLLVPNSADVSTSDGRVPCYNIHAVLRKTRRARFRCALETATSHAAVSAEISRRYAGEDTLPASPVANSSEGHGSKRSKARAKRFARFGYRIMRRSTFERLVRESKRLAELERGRTGGLGNLEGV